MKHLIVETNIKVQKDCQPEKWREIASFCNQSTRKVFSKLGAFLTLGYCRVVFFVVCFLVCVFCLFVFVFFVSV